MLPGLVRLDFGIGGGLVGDGDEVIGVQVGIIIPLWLLYTGLSIPALK